MEIKRVIVPFEKKAISEAGDFEGYGSTFGDVDFGGDAVIKGAFSRTLSEWKTKGQLPLMPWYHNMVQPIGDWLEMEEDDMGLFVKGKLWIEGSKRIDSAVMVHNLLTGTGPKGMSIGYATRESEYVEIEGKSVRNLIDVDLMELSIVPFGMNPNAIVTNAKSRFRDEDGELKEKRDFERVLREAGLSRKEAKAFLSKGWAGLPRDEGEGEADENEIAEIKETLKNIFHSLKG